MPVPADFAGPDARDDLASTPTQPLHQLLLTSASGTLALLTPLSESSYRRLSNLTAYLATVLDSPCGLNSRAFRAGESVEGGWDGGTGARGVIDGGLVMRWGELGEQRRREGLAKYGGGEWEIWGEREVLGGWGVFGGRGR